MILMPNVGDLVDSLGHRELLRRWLSLTREELTAVVTDT